MDAARSAHYIQTGVKRMEALIDDLLAYTQTMHTEDEPEPMCQLQKALERALVLLEEPMRTLQAVVTYDGLPIVTANEGQLTQVFQKPFGEQSQVPPARLNTSYSDRCDARRRVLAYSRGR